ncbi:MAG TPA: type IV toxin-antitoxin system AbiEi family antitoxin domain-containing protein [Gemmataceae bacterium]|nr:type IV toxin-antitoxin system AbiEi family antitoxin domain-containing protein [Gemmataceae bacterium]
MAGLQQDQVLEAVRRAGVLRPRDLKALGLPREHLRRLQQRGLVRRVSRGLYIAADADLTEKETLLEACKRVPRGVLCLLSALRFHGLTTQSPFEVWLAIGGKDWQPRVEYPPLRVLRFARAALVEGVEEHRIHGVTVRVTSPARTVADCFKYRHKIGLDVALEALRDCWRQRRATMDELWQAAAVCRVANVMRPYLESLV